MSGLAHNGIRLHRQQIYFAHQCCALYDALMGDHTVLNAPPCQVQVPDTWLGTQVFPEIATTHQGLQVKHLYGFDLMQPS